MCSCHKSLVNGWFKGWLLRSSCTRLKIAARLLLDSVLKLNMQFSTKSRPTIPSTCISRTAAWHQHLERRKWLTCCANWMSVHVTVSDSLTQTTGRSWPHNLDTLYFPMSWTFIISVSWPEAEHSLPGVVTTTSRPDGKQSQDGTVNTNQYDRQSSTK